VIVGLICFPETVYYSMLHSENMSSYERTLSKPYQQLTPKIVLCILYRVVLVAEK
jgi:hypothetical protein